MKRIDIYEYDRRSRELIVEAAERDGAMMITWSLFAQQNGGFSLRTGTPYLLIDVSSLIANEDRTANALPYLERVVSFVANMNKTTARLVMERQYSSTVKNLLYFRIDRVLSLEETLGLTEWTSTNIADLAEPDFESLCQSIDSRLFGNAPFKQALFEELRKFRVFSRTGSQHIFSAFLYGNSGIGKTETARLLHAALSPRERFIKINFGNYSGENALASLIGSPRGYVGSSKGELSEKLLGSRSTVLLIDEFEKASRPVHYFFLQLLEDGWFTDSLGRDYDLSKYIILFTSNLTPNRVESTLAPEFRSRLNLTWHLEDLSDDDKRAYVRFKVHELLERVPSLKRAHIPPELVAEVSDIDVTQTSDLRRINAEIMHRMAKELYPYIIDSEDEAK